MILRSNDQIENSIYENQLSQFFKTRQYHSMKIVNPHGQEVRQGIAKPNKIKKKRNIFRQLLMPFAFGLDKL